jgi:hypothetical protein
MITDAPEIGRALVSNSATSTASCAPLVFVRQVDVTLTGLAASTPAGAVVVVVDVDVVDVLEEVDVVVVVGGSTVVEVVDVEVVVVVADGSVVLVVDVDVDEVLDVVVVEVLVVLVDEVVVDDEVVVVDSVVLVVVVVEVVVDVDVVVVVSVVDVLVDVDDVVVVDDDVVVVGGGSPGQTAGGGESFAMNFTPSSFFTWPPKVAQKRVAPTEVTTPIWVCDAPASANDIEAPLAETFTRRPFLICAALTGPFARKRSLYL